VSLAGIEGSRDLLRRNDQVFDADAKFLGKGFDQIVFQAEDGALVIGVIGQGAAADGDGQIKLGRRRERERPFQRQRNALFATGGEEYR